MTKHKQTQTPKHYLVSEVARLTGYSTKRVDQLVYAGVLSPQKVAGLRVYTDTDVHALIDHRTRVQSKRNRAADHAQG